jgi:dynein heavy chain
LSGLVQSGGWGCFDEFNRIEIEVLSVVAQQILTIMAALSSRKTHFDFEGTMIKCNWSLGIFITMNPGYAGRSELPESLKVLFRPCAMVVPNMHMICEIMLAAEGFSESKMLSRKFMILYELCEDLLSKQRHYDFKLRAVKTTLNVAGAMKRAAPDMSEDKTLLRALRDFNVGKLVDADYGIFFGLLEDLFPKTLDLVPRARDEKFEGLITQAAKSLNFQCEEQFALKITQLREICEVRWSVFLLGPAGSGKTTLLKTLAATPSFHSRVAGLI